MRRHPQLGADAVKASGEMSKIVADVCLHHHERYDGSGYPHGLKGDDISLFARMAAICDTYDALASARPHRPAFGPAEAVAEMYKLKGHFDDSLLTSFIRSIGIYPAGSLVRLESQHARLRRRAAPGPAHPPAGPHLLFDRRSRRTCRSASSILPRCRSRTGSSRARSRAAGASPIGTISR